MNLCSLKVFVIIAHIEVLEKGKKVPGDKLLDARDPCKCYNFILWDITNHYKLRIFYKIALAVSFQMIYLDILFVIIMNLLFIINVRHIITIFPINFPLLLLLREVHEEAKLAREKASDLKIRRQEQAAARQEKLKRAYLKKQLEKLKASSKGDQI